MYNKIKNYISINREINEDNDYLLKEEYDSLLSMKEEFSDINEMLETYRKYAKPHFEKLLINKDDYIALKSISIVKPSEYNTHNNNGIRFLADIRGVEYTDITVQHFTRRSAIVHIEKGFNPKFIKYYYELLYRIAKNEEIDVCNYKFDDYVKFDFETEFINKVLAVESDIDSLHDLIEYYKDKVITVKQDQRLLDELKEIDDFFENL